MTFSVLGHPQFASVQLGDRERMPAFLEYMPDDIRYVLWVHLCSAGIELADLLPCFEKLKCYHADFQPTM